MKRTLMEKGPQVVVVMGGHAHRAIADLGIVQKSQQVQRFIDPVVPGAGRQFERFADRPHQSLRQLHRNSRARMPSAEGAGLLPC